MTDRITSISNPRIKHIRSLLANRKDRRRERMFVIEGVRLGEEALQSGTPIDTIVYDPEQLEATERGLWSEPDPDDLDILKAAYLENEGMLEERA